MTEADEPKARGTIHVFPLGARKRHFQIWSLDQVDTRQDVNVLVFPEGMGSTERDSHLKRYAGRFRRTKGLAEANVEVFTNRRNGKAYTALAFVVISCFQASVCTVLAVALVLPCAFALLRTPTSRYPSIVDPAKSYLAYELSKPKTDVSPADIEAGRADLKLFRAFRETDTVKGNDAR